MRFSFLTLVMLALMASHNTLAQRVGFPQSIPSELKAEVASFTTSASGYFSLQLKSARLQPDQWMKQNGQALGLTAKMTVEKTSEITGVDDRTYQRFRQYRDGAPVLGGDLIGQTDNRGYLRQLSGYFAANNLFVAPAAAALNIPDDELEAAAKRALVEDYPQALQWNAIDHGDTWASATPWKPSSAFPFHRCRTLEIQEPAGGRAEMVYLDLRTGKVVFRHALHCSLQRQLHYRNTSTANIVWREGDAFPGSLNAEDQEMVRATEEVFSLYHRSFGREGYDGNGGDMRLVNQAAMSGCPNARAYNYTILACDGVVGDDIVGHEWTHNYTNAMSGLLLSFESGAIHEGMADIFGEAVDLLNDRGLDLNDQFPREDCFTDNYRWSIAEDATAIDTILRDLWAPNCKTDPEKRTSPLFICNSPTGPDIHSNSAVLSRTFALLVDGDTITSPSVRGIGLTKALHIFYHANANYVTRVTDFSALATMLRQSAQDLQDINLPALTLINTVAPLSNDSITEADLASLDSAMAVTELALPNTCPSTPVLEQNPPEACEEPEQVFITVFSEDWEGDTSGWVLSENPVYPEDWSPKPWRLNEIALPDGRPGRAIFAPNAHVGNCQSDRENGTSELTSPIITLPDMVADFQLQFTHYFSIEPNTDGGLLSYRMVGEETFTPVPRQAFTFNRYNELLDPASINNNPIAGAYAFSGADDLSTTGSWGKSVVDLNSLGLMPGSQFQLQWVLGHDGCDGWLGWYIDDIEVGFCGSRALPVTYLSFTATAGKDFVDLAWQTASEINNAGFYVERSSSDRFETIDFVGANTTNSYSIRDTAVTPGKTYLYRLRQVDYDGQVQYSSLVTATLAEHSDLLIYPNPAPGFFQVVGSGEFAVVYDLNGRQLMSKSLRSGQCAFASLQAGIYLVKVGSQIRRIVVK